MWGKHAAKHPDKEGKKGEAEIHTLAWYVCTGLTICGVSQYIQQPFFGLLLLEDCGASAVIMAGTSNSKIINWCLFSGGHILSWARLDQKFFLLACTQKSLLQLRKCL